ncbi:carbohydrate sulfotransferase 11-like [Saccoglossus kowalevskii]|uniref:Carbohydrate sulfotransferase n=1 Tax=Saccoglossus kowalevskii TaxID=10224 RepID=A0ABM0MP30_SACKO|nr:PREDICTED: carbohydrate sulfotransferase 11-like [Saccoglossus kowalevskii]
MIQPSSKRFIGSGILCFIVTVAFVVYSDDVYDVLTPVHYKDHIGATLLTSENYSLVDSEPGELLPANITQTLVSSLGYDDRTSIYQSRRDKIYQACEKYENRFKKHRHKLPLHNLYISQKHKFIYCAIPKVGCTNWFKTLLVLSGQFKQDDVIGWREINLYRRAHYGGLREYNKLVGSGRVGEFIRFVVVRHPFTRLVSLFAQKLDRRPDRRLISELLSKMQQITESNSSTMNFHNFVDYLIKTKEPTETWNSHFRPMHLLCFPCNIDYDIIGHLETIHEDSEYLFHEIGSTLSYPKKSSRTATNSSTTDNLLRYFSTISDDQIWNLYKIYKMDFEMFGYSPSEFFPFPNKNRTQNIII